MVWTILILVTWSRDRVSLPRSPDFVVLLIKKDGCTSILWQSQFKHSERGSTEGASRVSGQMCGKQGKCTHKHVGHVRGCERNNFNRGVIVELSVVGTPCQNAPHRRLCSYVSCVEIFEHMLNYIIATDQCASSVYFCQGRRRSICSWDLQ